MGKKKQASAAMLPKRIGGVKLSKGLRRSLAALLQIADSSVGRQVLTAALAAAATRLAKAQPGEENAAGKKRSDSDPGATTHELADWLGRAAAAIIVAAQHSGSATPQPPNGDGARAKKQNQPSLSS